MVKEFGEGSVEAEKAATNYNNQAAALNNLERYVEGVTKEMKEFAEQQRIAESGWGKFGKKMDEMGSKLTSIGDKMKSVGKNMSMYVTAPIVGIGAAAVKVAWRPTVLGRGLESESLRASGAPDVSPGREGSGRAAAHRDGGRHCLALPALR